jgi:hypothetical protein
MENDTILHGLFLFNLKACTEDVIHQGVNIATMPKLDFRLFIANKITWITMSTINVWLTRLNRGITLIRVNDYYLWLPHWWIEWLTFRTSLLY